MLVSNERLKELIEMDISVRDSEKHSVSVAEWQEVARELLKMREGQQGLGIYFEMPPRNHPRFNVVYIDENKVCGYTIHNGKFSALGRKRFNKNFRRLEFNHS
jgi:hypothetical protein